MARGMVGVRIGPSRWMVCGRFPGLAGAVSLLIAFLALGFGGPAVSQAGGGFQGRITDIISGLPIVGATIQVETAFPGDFSTQSRAEGQYRLPVPPGIWAVRASAPGYIGMTQTYQRLAEGAWPVLDFQMIPVSLRPDEEAILREKLPLQHPDPPTPAELEAAARARIGPLAVTEVPRTIRVLMPDGTVVVMEMDEYLKGVLPSEMWPTWPIEALKAQAVAARSYAATVRKHAHQGADVCTTTHCQVWRPIHYDITDRAVDATHGVATTYDGSIIQAYFHGHCDGHTRNSEDVWVSALPYLRSVACPCGFTWMWGHGVGMCQEGARTLAQQGVGYADILRHYYTGIEITSPAPPELRDGQVSPWQGDRYTSFVFQVTYAEGTGKPPAEAVVQVDGLSYAMTRAGGDLREGARYVYTATLPVGDHAYRFHFDDGHGHALDWPADGPAAGPSVIESSPDVPTPSPTPLPPVGVTQGGAWSQSTVEDWQEGIFTDVLTTSLGNGALILAEGAISGTYTSAIRHCPFEFVAIGSSWRADLPEGTAMTLSLRASTDGETWSDWQMISDADAEREMGGLPYGELVFAPGRYLQYRLHLRRATLDLHPVVSSLTLYYMDSRWGPTAAEARSQAIRRAAADGAPVIISREEWAANEAWRGWPPEYRPVKTFIIHHTVTSSGGVDPAAVVRAIYYYHAVTRGWGDIGYNYLIDDRGNIYEGRYGGEIEGPEGLEGVVGGHARNYNWGSIGIALLGDYSHVTPSPAALASLVQLIAWKGNRHFVRPLEESFFIDQVLPNIMGHRDCSSYTTCPGDGLYALLPSIRSSVMDRMEQIPPYGHIVQPGNGALLRGVQGVIVKGSPAATTLSLWVDEQFQTTAWESPFSWKWNTTQVADGSHRLRLVARTTLGHTHESIVFVHVDNTPPSGRLSLSPFVRSREIAIETEANEADRMQLSLGWLWEGEELRHETGSGRIVPDPAAVNGQAWQGRAGLDRAGWWYGPYLCDLPVGNYWAYWRLRVADNSSSQVVARLETCDDEGLRIYAETVLEGWDFPSVAQYSEFPLAFSYRGPGDTCQVPDSRDGLEFQTYFPSHTDLYLDRVQLFTAPQPYALQLAAYLMGEEGRKEVSVRFLDTAGNPSEVYTATTLLDMTPPIWLQAGNYVLVQDMLSGMDTESGAYALSSDGLLWGAWQPAVIDGSPGVTTPVFIRGWTDNACFIRYRARDRAGNLALSPSYPLGCTPTASPTPVPSSTVSLSPTPTPSWTPAVSPSASPTLQGISSFLPLILRRYNPATRPTATWTPSPTLTETPTTPDTPTPTASASPTETPTATETSETTATPSYTATASATVSPTFTATLTLTPTPTASPTFFVTILVSGTVYDAAIGPSAPISDVHLIVSISRAGQQKDTYSDAQGAYEARFQVSAALQEVRVDVFAEHPVYSVELRSADTGPLTPGDTVSVRVDVAMHLVSTPTPSPVPTPTLYMSLFVYGRVYEAGSDPPVVIPSPQVTVYLPHHAPQAAATDSLGRYWTRFVVTGDGESPLRVDVLAQKEGYWPRIASGFAPGYLPGTIQYVPIDIELTVQSSGGEL